MEKNFKIFTDFDGTISLKDIGDEIFQRFADEEKVRHIIRKLLNDEITSKDCWIELCRLASPVNEKQLEEFIIQQEVEISFPHFVEFCTKQNFELFILSDGFDYYIKKILSKNIDFSNIKIFSNKWEITESGDIIPEFPYYDSTFTSSANCKRNHIINNSSDDDYTVFIGDGNSDKDAVNYCDFIFAKNDLLKYCEKERITYFPFKDFDDVISKLNELNKKKRLKKRYQAELKRRQAYMIE